MTATQCLEFCRGQEFSLAAVNTTSCFCLKADEVLSWQPKSSIDWCFQSCPGFDNQPCGGNNLFSVYEAGEYHTSTYKPTRTPVRCIIKMAVLQLNKSCILRISEKIRHK